MAWPVNCHNYPQCLCHAAARYDTGCLPGNQPGTGFLSCTSRLPVSHPAGRKPEHGETRFIPGLRPLAVSSKQ